MVTRHAGVHRLRCGGAPPGYRHKVFDATAIFVQRRAQAREVTATVMAVHRPIFLERDGFRDLAGMVTATPRAVPLPCHVWCLSVYTKIWKKSHRDSKAPKIMSSMNQLRADRN